MVRVLAVVCVVSVLTAPAFAQAPASGACVPAGDVSFGTKDKTDVSIEGRIYFLPEDTEKLPDFRALKSQGSIYTDKWDVPAREFTAGFPGVTNRFEWFAIDYNGSIYVPAAGTYAFRLNSDDGSKLYLDGKVVVDNDGQHGMSDTSGSVQLAKGDHAFRLSYFQGPATEIGLQLFVTPPGQEEKIFTLQDFNRTVLDNRSLLGVVETGSEIRIQFGAEVLFDTAKYDLKPAAESALKQLALFLRAYPAHPIVIEGHTDAVGSAASNQVLSENRAKSVKTWLVTNGGVAAACVTTQGYGLTKPVATNDTPEGRQKNRRVEVKIEKGGS